LEEISILNSGIKYTTLSESHRRFKVLIISKALSRPGGVVNFISMVLGRLSTEIDFTHFRLGANDGSEKRSNIFRVIWDTLRFVKIVKSNDWNCIHLNPSFTWRSLTRDGLLLLILVLFRYPNTLIFFHGWCKQTIKGVNDTSILRKLTAWVLNHSAHILVLHSDYKNMLIKLGVRHEKISITTTMYDRKLFEGVTPLNKKLDKISVLFLGRLVKEKGVYELLSGFQTIRKTHPNTRLVLAGDGIEKEKLENWVIEHNLDNQIDFMGYLRGKRKASLLLSSDIFVLPSYGEGCPVALLEAMAAGLPIVATAVGCIPDIIIPNVNGIIVDNCNPQSISRALIKLIDDPGMRRVMQTNNRRTALRKFEAAVIINHLEDFYKNPTKAII
jgi:glycosyltransferase involved in cell wall biosynthesis